MEKISELTPYLNQNKKKLYFKKTIKSLDSTKKLFKDSQSLTGVELKEFSLLYLIVNNLELIQENLHLVENVRIFTEINKQIFNEMVKKLKTDKKILNDDLNIDLQILDRINKFAPIKNILKNKPKNEYEIIEFFEDIKRDLINYNLEHRIHELESKFSKDLSEVTFNELKELKKKQNIN